MKAEKVLRKDYHTHYKVDITQSAICLLASHTHTFIFRSVAVLC